LATGVSNLIPAVNAALPSINFSNPFSSSGSSSGSSNNLTNGSIGDQGSQTPTIPIIGPDGKPTGQTQPNPNYDPYADPNATPDQISAFNQQQLYDYYSANNN
jgi:hypothetical protein